jgi:hypothetical protein
MPVNRSVKKLVALMLAGAAVAGAAEISSGVVGVRAAAAASSDQGNPHAVPPILRAASPSELAEIRVAEAWEGQELYYDPPATARYSSAVLNVYARAGK